MNGIPHGASSRILVVEDDDKIAALLCDYLTAGGFSPEREAHGVAAVRRVQEDPPAAVLLDLMIPGLDGMEVCRAIRRFSAVPILMLTARVEEIDRVMGLEVGADDYICKPFSPREVMARLRAQLRRAQGLLGPAVTHAGWAVDEAARVIRWQGQALPLTPLEFKLARLLMSQSGRVFSRLQMLDVLHEDLRDVSDRAVDSHIKNLRKKMQQAAGPAGQDAITSVYGVGYRFEPAGEGAAS
jgi:two-component system response regulator BaeR